MHLLLLSTDLMMIASAQGAADRRKAALHTAATTEEAIEDRDSTVKLIVIDLRTPRLDVSHFVPKARAAYPQARIVACGPHVHKQSLAAAAAAGCDEVITRGEFDRGIDAILDTLTLRAASDPMRPK